jgi:hypothetical protein
MKPIQDFSLNLFADYSQFYIQDENVDGDLSDKWTDFTTEINLALADGTIGIGTARNTTVPVTLKIFDTEPELINDSDNIIGQLNECDLEVRSGKIVIAGCTEYFREAKRVELQNGTYRARIYYCNFDKISLDGLSGDDFYEIHLWLTNKKEDMKIIKGRYASR